MLWIPQKGQLQTESNVGATANATLGTSVTTGAASATKGTVAQLIASTSFDSYLMQITAADYGTSATASAGCLDILVGGSGSEIALISNLLMGACGGMGIQIRGPKHWLFPIYIPAGTRISAQAAGLRLSTAFKVSVYLWGGKGYPPFKVGTQVDTYGIGTVPNGTTITEGASGAEGNWAQITASTTRDHFCIVPSYQYNDATLLDAFAQADVGIGAAASEQQIGHSYNYSLGTIDCMDGPYPLLPIFKDVPSGTRLAMRASCSSTTNTANGALHGVS